MNTLWMGPLSELQALVEGFAAPCTHLEAAEGLMSRAANWRLSVDEARRSAVLLAGGEGGSGESSRPGTAPTGGASWLTPKQKAKLKRCMCLLGDYTVALNSYLLQKWDPDCSAQTVVVMHQSNAACLVSAACAHLARECQLALTAAEAQRILGCMQLVCGSGILVLQIVIKRTQQGGEEVHHLPTPVSLQTQVVQGLLLLAAPCGSRVQAAAYEQVEALLHWLEAAVACNATLRASCNRPGTPYAATLGALVDLLGTLCSEPYLKHMKGMATEHSDLHSTLIKLLVGALPAAAVAARLPADRWPPEFSWQRAADMAAVICLEVADPALQAEIAAAAATAGTQPGRSAAGSARLLQWAAQLVQQVPCGGPPGQCCLEHAVGLARLLDVATELQLVHLTGAPGSAPSAPADEREWQQTAAALLPTLPKLVAMLREAASRAAGEAVQVVSSTLTHVAELLFKGLEITFSRTSGTVAAQIGSLAELQGWCRGAAAALRALPPAADAAQAAWQQLGLQSRPEQQQSAEALQQRIAALGGAVLGLAAHVGEAAVQAAVNPSTIAGLELPSSRAAAVEALWQLHTAGCRVAAYHAQAVARSGGGSGSGGAQEGRACLQGRSVLDFLPLFTLPMIAANHLLSGCMQQAAARAGTAEQTQVDRALRAMAVAHVAALEPLLSQLRPPAGLQDCFEATLLSRTISSLRAVVECGPPALAVKPLVEQMLSSALHQLLKVPLVRDGCLRALLSTCAFHSPHLGALLFAGGALERLAGDLGEASPGDNLVECIMEFATTHLLCNSFSTHLQVEPIVEFVPLSVLKLSEAAANVVGAAAGVGHAASSAGAAGAAAAATRAATLHEQLLAAINQRLAAASAELGPYFPEGCCPSDMRLPELRPLRKLLAVARPLAAALLVWWRRREQAAEGLLELAQVAATRSCAYLRCCNLGGEGGPAAGAGVGSRRCSACRAVWYCSTACSHADWRAGGHWRVCRALEVARQQAKAQGQQ